MYVGGSSGECIYQHVDERKKVLEAVMEEAKGKLTVIAHVGCNNTADSVELAAHAQSVGADAIASIPPIYFHLPEYAIAEYWNAMSAAAPDLDFVIYNIPQLAGTALSMNLLKEMLKNPNVIAVKNSSMPTQDIQMFKAEGVKERGEKWICCIQRTGRTVRIRTCDRRRRRNRWNICGYAGIICKNGSAHPRKVISQRQ